MFSRASRRLSIRPASAWRVGPHHVGEKRMLESIAEDCPEGAGDERGDHQPKHDALGSPTVLARTHEGLRSRNLFCCVGYIGCCHTQAWPQTVTGAAGQPVVQL